MPSHYAHYYFGNEVVRIMPGDVKDIINHNGDTLDAYTMGLHGPDFLAFYRPWKKNSLRTEGSRIHMAAGREFMRSAAAKLKKNPQPEAYSYVFGCITHFVLDACCHPIIDEYTVKSSLSHGKLEREFDNFILRICKKSPRRVNLDRLFPHNEHLDEIIAGFYQSATADKTHEAIETMNGILSAFSHPRRNTRRNIYRVLSLVPKKSIRESRDMIYREDEEPRAVECNGRLFDALNKAVTTAANELDAFMNYMLLDEPLDEFFSQNYLGTDLSNKTPTNSDNLPKTTSTNSDSMTDSGSARED